MVIKTGLIPRIAISFCGIDIYWYAILIVLGMVLGILICKLKDGKFGIKFDEILNLCLFMLPISIISARLYYIIFTLDYFLVYPLEILNIRDGGLAIYGGIIGAVITILVYCKIKKIQVLDLLDYIVPSLALGQSIGRWGNYINVEAYGSETTLPIGMEVIEKGVTKFVHPTFLYESIITLAIFIILVLITNKRKFRGELTYLYIIIYSCARTFIEYLRTDSLMLFNFKISLILSVILFVIFSFIFVYKLYKTNNEVSNVERCRKRSYEKRLKRNKYQPFLLTSDKKYVIIFTYKREK